MRDKLFPQGAAEGRDLPVGLGRGARQDEARALGQALRRGRTTRPLFQRLPFFGGQHDERCVGRRVRIDVLRVYAKNVGGH